jgi:hypothetical protein
MCARPHHGLVVAGEGHGDEAHGYGAGFGCLFSLVSVCLFPQEDGIVKEDGGVEAPFFAIVGEGWRIGRRA